MFRCFSSRTQLQQHCAASSPRPEARESHKSKMAWTCRLVFCFFVEKFTQIDWSQWTFTTLARWKQSGRKQGWWKRIMFERCHKWQRTEGTLWSKVRTCSNHFLDSFLDCKFKMQDSVWIRCVCYGARNIGCIVLQFSWWSSSRGFSPVGFYRPPFSWDTI